MKQLNYLRFTVFFLPILFLIVGLNFNRAKHINDPDYIYLVNALAICDGKSVGHIDNPGTTVMQIGAATISIMHLFSNPENETLVTHVLKNPDKFIEGIQTVSLILNSIIILLLGWIVFLKTGSVWAALLLQLFTFLTSNTLDHLWTKVSPEPILFLITTIYVILIFYFYTDKQKDAWKYVFLFSLVTGAGLATKATFLPLVIFPFVVLPSLKKKFIYLGSIIPSFVLFTIPAIPEYERMYYWFKNLISHSGRYGQGEKGFIDLDNYLTSIIKILENNPLFGIVVGLGIVVVIVSLIQIFLKSKKDRWEIRIITGLIASSIFGILLVAKHYHANHYLLPVLTLSGVNLFFILKVILNSGLPPILKSISWPIVFIGFFIFLAWKQPSKMKTVNMAYKISNEEMDSTWAMIDKDYPDYLCINYYTFSLNKYTALKFGDVYTKNKMLPNLKSIYPSTYFYDSSKNQFLYWNAVVELKDIIELWGNKILLVNGPKDQSKIDEMNANGIPLKNIYTGRIQTIYELDTLKYKQINNKSNKKIARQIICGAEVLSKDGERFLGNNGETFGSSASRSSEFSRSGNHSFKMDKNTSFSLDFHLENLKAGEKYEVEVWRKSDNNSSHLVIGAEDSNVFYKTENDFIKVDENGWKLIRIRFTATKEMENSFLKIYLWNVNKKLAYFDDLSIKQIEMISSADNPNSTNAN